MIRTLLRLPLCSAVAGASLAGYLAAGGAYGARAAWLGLGVLSAAAGASVLNQWQERHTDARMERTRCRPLASGRLKPATGLSIGLGLAISGALLLTALDRRSGLLSLSIFLLYHLVYTPLKRHTVLALLPGTLCGALPLAIGWLAGGGRGQDPRLTCMTAILLLWQIPHSWYILLQHRPDLRRAGLFPELHLLPVKRLRQLIFVWILALSTATLSLPALTMPDSTTVRWLCTGLATWPLVALRPFATGKNREPIAGWQHSTGVVFLGTVMALLLFH
ncbi:protoheme IX farnesyltransferase [Syntrophotalea carbinolica DSM 2380]|uniref:heme o synthase n=1 Tax=Syntrophotalea carbinolica (strain DSM 2380 / NBRC 103641 / GraBd1) TaxID=338963 RepID=Q3A1I9_SYNC1|nr:UbiA family prenyltransferase [Syntrophotalea carbinolica]ABA89768.1 protoheme IX farnesyltransferase [Syntrophotalea carbinolica DSM 2380]